MWKRFSPRNQGSDSTGFNSHIKEETIYIRYARKKENKTNQARESDRATRETDNETKRAEQGSERAGQRNKESRTTKQRETNNETKRAGQESEGVEHPLTFGSYINNQIGK